MNLYQTTLAKSVQLEGHGLHSGLKATIRIEPAPCGEGITFRRRDRGARIIKASAENVSATDLSTCLGQGNDSISTVEHVLSALYGLSIDNARVICSGPEVPILEVTDSIFPSLLTLPIHPDLTLGDVEFICNKLTEYLS